MQDALKDITTELQKRNKLLEKQNDLLEEINKNLKYLGNLVI